MARKTRIEFPGAFYHVFARGNNKQKIFKDDQDYKVYILDIKKYHERYKFILYAYALMPNHIHFLIETGITPLSKIMQGLQQSYTSYFHKKYKSVGHVFQARYKAILCQRDAYLLELVRYIHLNAVRAVLADSPEKYPWSSHLVYLGYLRQSFIEKDFIFKLLSDNRYAAEKIYIQFIKDGMDKGHQEKYYNAIDQCFLGSSDFVSKVKQRIKGQDQNKNHNRKKFIQDQQDQTFIEKRALSEILETVAKIMQTSSESVLSKSREQRISDVRSLCAFLAVRKAGVSNKILAEFFGRDPSSVSNMIRKVEERIDKDHIFSNYLNQVMKVMKA
jgi:putative transposase